MNVEELQIGDYVRIPRRNKIGKVYRIDRANGEGNGHAAVIDGDYHEKDLEPIPLTAEILEKNGFYYDEDRKAYLMGVIFRVKPEKYGLFSFEICGCPYPLNTVHQLQHALRLCGIEKKNKTMIEWRIDRPQGDIIVAKITESFCYKKECYEVLHYTPMPYPHYSDAWCEEVPYSAIEKWSLIK